MAQKKRIGVFPGSFNPITIGHVDIVRQALPLFEEIIIALGTNTSKKYLFSADQRLKWLKETFRNEPKVKVMAYEGLTVDFCKKNGATYIIRGIRNATDFAYEQTIAQMNKKLESEIETVLFSSLPEHSCISSTVVREIYVNGGRASQFIPAAIKLPKL